MAYVLVFLGGGLGSLARYGVARLIAPIQGHFPYATLTANLISCLVLGFMLQQSLRGQVSDAWKWLLMTGFCGGFSTFSTFSGETLSLLQHGHYGTALMNMGGSLLLGLICIYLGMRLGAG
ncbi:fluoride efflux transporter CrcB [Phaeodactylibacter luteus]|uniref:Fluoride-specific ion channel FluC n=1 Tax=Phaeodactylibacter luteus TaxID=1564516 RepID=A0A5C6RVB1_9BACT|nr:fluoride efflux transporter CrcB [Phaeodactylibacter luteus]TXB66291.1 fluoride efflux transporter CrcB [Phaeodactylibacter luteus]